MSRGTRSTPASSSRSRKDPAKGRRPTPPVVRHLVVVATMLVLLYAFAQPLYVVPDSAAYLAYARSLVWDIDVDFDNEYARLGMVETGVGGSQLAARTETGKRGNPFGIGTALLWLPFIGVTALLARLAALFGANVATDGFGMATLWAAHLATWTCLLASIALTWRTLTEFPGAARAGGGPGAEDRVEAGTSAVKGGTVPALIGAFLATPLVYYVLQMPSYSHAASVFVTALLLYLSLRWRGQWTPSRAIVLGAIVGLEGLVRTQGILFWIVPLVIHWRGGAREFVRTQWKLVALYTASAVVCFAPQIVVWTIVYGSPWRIPQGEGFLHVGLGRFFGVLFSTRHGLLVWSPVFVPAVAGWILMLRQSGKRSIALAFLVAFGLQWFVNMLPNDWWAGWSFGARRFIDFVPFVAAGLVVFSRLGRVARWAVYALTTLNILQWLRISTGGISGEIDPGWDALWGSGFLASLARAPQALWTVLEAFPADMHVIRRPTALPPTLHSDATALFDLMFAVWALLVLVAAYKTHVWWGIREATAEERTAHGRKRHGKGSVESSDSSKR